MKACTSVFRIQEFFFTLHYQDLTISLSTERSDKEVDLIEDQTSLSSINTQAFMDQEWSIYKHIETSRDFTTVEYCSSTVHPILHAQCRVARKMGYFVWNIIFIMVSLRLNFVLGLGIVCQSVFPSVRRFWPFFS